MSLNIVREQIERFLASDEPEVMAIRGSWGVGKTYTWNKLLKDSKDKEGIACKNYSYVSLFGICSLEALKYAIFEQMISIDLIGKSPSLDTFKSNADKLLASLGRKSFQYFQGAPLIKLFAPAIESASFLSLNTSIICIDDFERKSDSVSLKDILGLVLLLKEQRNCKIVLVLNDEKMESESSEEFKTLREKVIDLELEFKPTSNECTEIALPNRVGFMIEVGNVVEKLEISNIRIIKKIERLANILHNFLEKYEKEVFSQAVHTLCLYAFCFYSSEKTVPNYNYVKNIGYALFGLDDKKEISDEEKGWNAFLREYGYQHADEFDLRIAEAVENGYVDEERLREESEKLNAQFLASKSESSFSTAWNLYHESFSDNQDEVVNGLYESFKKNAKYISRVNLNGTVRLFRELGYSELANEILEIYITNHLETPAIFDLSSYSFSGDITDPVIIERFSQLSEEHSETKIAKDVLSRIAGKNGWGKEDEIILANTTSDEYFHIFKSEQGDNLYQFVDTCLQFGRFTNTSEQQQTIADNATIALKRIARESLINERRVKKYGVNIEADDVDEKKA